MAYTIDLNSQNRLTYQYYCLPTIKQKFTDYTNNK